MGTREEIFQKEVLTIKDLEFLLDIDYNSSAKLIRQIKFKHDRLGIQGKLHVEDYFDYFNIVDRTRYAYVSAKN